MPLGGGMLELVTSEDGRLLGIKSPSEGIEKKFGREEIYLNNNLLENSRLKTKDEKEIITIFEGKNGKLERRIHLNKDKLVVSIEGNGEIRWYLWEIGDDQHILLRREVPSSDPIKDLYDTREVSGETLLPEVYFQERDTEGRMLEIHSVKGTLIIKGVRRLRIRNDESIVQSSKEQSRIIPPAGIEIIGENKIEVEMWLEAPYKRKVIKRAIIYDEDDLESIAAALSVPPPEAGEIPDPTFRVTLVDRLNFIPVYPSGIHPSLLEDRDEVIILLPSEKAKGITSHLKKIGKKYHLVRRPYREKLYDLFGLKPREDYVIISRRNLREICLLAPLARYLSIPIYFEDEEIPRGAKVLIDTSKGGKLTQKDIFRLFSNLLYVDSVVYNFRATEILCKRIVGHGQLRRVRPHRILMEMDEFRELEEKLREGKKLSDYSLEISRKIPFVIKRGRVLAILCTSEEELVNASNYSYFSMAPLLYFEVNRDYLDKIREKIDDFLRIDPISTEGELLRRTLIKSMGSLLQRGMPKYASSTLEELSPQYLTVISENEIPFEFLPNRGRAWYNTYSMGRLKGRNPIETSLIMKRSMEKELSPKFRALFLFDPRMRTSFDEVSMIMDLTKELFEEARASFLGDAEGHYEIVHFSGHSDDDGIYLLRGKSNSIPAKGEVFFANSCNSGIWGEGKLPKRTLESGFISYIGNRWKLDSGRAMRVAEGFYKLLSMGASIGLALKIAKSIDEFTSSCYVLYGDPTMRIRRAVSPHLLICNCEIDLSTEIGTIEEKIVNLETKPFGWLFDLPRNFSGIDVHKIWDDIGEIVLNGEITVIRNRYSLLPGEEYSYTMEFTVKPKRKSIRSWEFSWTHPLGEDHLTGLVESYTIRITLPEGAILERANPRPSSLFEGDRTELVYRGERFRGERLNVSLDYYW